jgi:hypothetical protein
VKPDLGDSPKRAMPKHEKKKPVEIIDEKKSHRKGKSKHKKRKSKN